jgi:hypothetical protein
MSSSSSSNSSTASGILPGDVVDAKTFVKVNNQSWYNYVMKGNPKRIRIHESKEWKVDIIVRGDFASMASPSVIPCGRVLAFSVTMTMCKFGQEVVLFSFTSLVDHCEYFLLCAMYIDEQDALDVWSDYFVVSKEQVIPCAGVLSAPPSLRRMKIGDEYRNTIYPMAVLDLK